MNGLSRIALAAALALAAPGVAVITTSSAIAQETLSQAVGNPLTEARSQLNSGNTRAARASVEQARAAAKTAFERRTVAQMSAVVHARTGRFIDAAKELETAGGTPAQLAPFYYQGGDYNKAIELAKRGGNSERMQLVIGQSYLKLNQFDKAVDYYQGLINQFGAKKQWLINLSGAQFKKGDKAGYLATVEKLIRLDPSKDNWSRLLTEMKKERLPQGPALALLMLMAETGTLKSDDFEEYAKYTILGNAPGLAAETLREAAVQGTLPEDDKTARLVQAANSRAATSAQQAEQAAASGDAMKAGMLLLGIGENDKAIAQLTKAAATNPQAEVMLGVAQVRAGQTKKAVDTFRGVSSDSPFADVSSLWALYSSVKG